MKKEQIKKIISNWKELANELKEFMVWFHRNSIIQANSFNGLLFRKWKSPLKYLFMILLWPIEFILTCQIWGVFLLFLMFWLGLVFMIAIFPLVMFVRAGELKSLVGSASFLGFILVSLLVFFLVFVPLYYLSFGFIIKGLIKFGNWLKNVRKKLEK